MLGVSTLGAALLATILFAMFTLGQASILLRGLEADCGCFGAGEAFTWLTFLRTLGLLGAAVLCGVVAGRSRRETAGQADTTADARHIAAAST